jgi:hypothetical protein
LRDIGGARAVAATNPVISQQPDVADPSDRLIGCLRNGVGIGEPTRSQTGQYGLELIRFEADQAEIEIGKPELLELIAQQIEIPLRPRRQLIVGQAIGTLFRLTPTARDDHRDRPHSRSWSGRHTPLTGNQHALLVDQHRVGPTPLDDRGGDFVEVGRALQPGVVGVGC